jgi:hypothetical protein
MPPSTRGGLVSDIEIRTELSTDARERCLSFDIEQKCNQDCKSSSHQTDPGYRNPGLQKRISIYVLPSQTLGDMMSYSNGAGRANAKAAYSVASSGDIEVGFFPLTGHDSLLLVLSQFLLFLLGIHELIPSDATRIKPL